MSHTNALAAPTAASTATACALPLAHSNAYILAVLNVTLKRFVGSGGCYHAHLGHHSRVHLADHSWVLVDHSWLRGHGSVHWHHAVAGIHVRVWHTCWLNRGHAARGHHTGLNHAWLPRHHNSSTVCYISCIVNQRRTVDASCSTTMRWVHSIKNYY